eukprot:1143393-Pelagomonas_calceolata.AAC.2
MQSLDGTIAQFAGPGLQTKLKMDGHRDWKGNEEAGWRNITVVDIKKHTSRHSFIYSPRPCRQPRTRLASARHGDMKGLDLVMKLAVSA